MGRKRKIFTGVKPIGGHTVRSLREARRITSKFHELNNEIGQLNENAEDTSMGVAFSDEISTKKQKIIQEIEELGGRNRYQQASVVTTSHHKTSKWVISSLRQLGIYNEKNREKLNTLEIGAINIQLQRYSGLRVRAIDINSQHPSIEELDFFELIPEGNYDLIVCSMVVNCVSTPELRAEMLVRLSLHLKPLTGILCLVLPSRCVKGSISKDDLAFRNLLKAFNLCTPSADRFPTLGCSNCDSFDLNSILLHTTPKLSFYILMHSSSTSFPTYFPTPSLHHLQQWILHVPQQSSASKDEPEQGQVSENSILNLTALLISLQHSLFSWSSSGKRLALSSQMNQFLSKAMVKLLFEYCDSTPAALEECQEDGSISGFTLHVPDSLILLLLSTNLPPNLHNSPEIRAPDPEAGTSSHSRSRTCRARSISENKK